MWGCVANRLAPRSSFGFLKQAGVAARAHVRSNNRSLRLRNSYPTDLEVVDSAPSIDDTSGSLNVLGLDHC